MSSDGTIPFDPNRRRKGRPAHPELHRSTRRAGGRAQDLVAAQSRQDRDRYDVAAGRQHAERLLATGRPVPARITMALDMRGLEGPEVDWACGAQEPDVDLWECGLTVPTAEQVVRLAELTRFPVAFFYRPVRPGPHIGAVYVCGPKGCVRVEPDIIDEHGVLHYAGTTRTPPAGAWQQALHLDEDGRPDDHE